MPKNFKLPFKIDIDTNNPSSKTVNKKTHDYLNRGFAQAFNEASKKTIKSLEDFFLDLFDEHRIQNTRIIKLLRKRTKELTGVVDESYINNVIAKISSQIKKSGMKGKRHSAKPSYFESNTELDIFKITISAFFLPFDEISEAMNTYASQLEAVKSGNISHVFKSSRNIESIAKIRRPGQKQDIAFPLPDAPNSFSAKANAREAASILTELSQNFPDIVEYSTSQDILRVLDIANSTAKVQKSGDEWNMVFEKSGANVLQEDLAREFDRLSDQLRSDFLELREAEKEIGELDYESSKYSAVYDDIARLRENIENFNKQRNEVRKLMRKRSSSQDVDNDKKLFEDILQQANVIMYTRVKFLETKKKQLEDKLKSLQSSKSGNKGKEIEEIRLLIEEINEDRAYNEFIDALKRFRENKLSEIRDFLDPAREIFQKNIDRISSFAVSVFERNLIVGLKNAFGNRIKFSGSSSSNFKNYIKQIDSELKSLYKDLYNTTDESLDFGRFYDAKNILDIIDKDIKISQNMILDSVDNFADLERHIRYVASFLKKSGNIENEEIKKVVEKADKKIAELANQYKEEIESENFSNIDANTRSLLSRVDSQSKELSISIREILSNLQGITSNRTFFRGEF